MEDIKNIDLDNISTRATSGSFYSSFGSNSGYRIVLEWKRNSVDIANNKSNVTVTAYLQSTGSSYTINSSVTKNGTMTINGTSYSFTFSASLSGSQKKQIYSKTVDIYHNSDGTKSFSMSVSAGIKISFGSGYVDTVSTSGTGALDTIPRASSFTLNTTSATLGSTSVTVNISRASSSFTHKVYVVFGSNTTTYSTNATTSVSFTPDISLCSQIPNTTSGTATVYVQTLNGSTVIGTASKTITYTVPASVVPTFTSLTASVVASGAPTNFGYVQGKSKCKLVINGASGSYGSTIKSYKITGNGGTWTTQSTTTGVLGSAGTFTYTATVTDSRGRTSTAKTVSITVQAYSAPKITSFSVIRCTSNGSASNEGTYIKASVQYSYTSLSSKNSASANIVYKLAPNGANSSPITISSGNDVVVGGGSISTSSSYAVTLTLSDNFTTVTKVLNVSPSYVTIDFKAGGKGVAIGKISTRDEFEVQSTTRFYSGVNTFSDAYNVNCMLDIIESTTSAGVGQSRIRVGGSGTGSSFGLMVQGPSDNTYAHIGSHGIKAGSNNASDLGSTSYRWRTVYAVNALNTSDKKYKENIEYVDINSDTKNISDSISQEDIYSFYKDAFKLSRYNYKEQDHKEYGFIAQDLVEDNVGKTIVVDDENGYMYSVGSYISTIAGALQYEINLRDKQIEELASKLEKLEQLLK